MSEDYFGDGHTWGDGAYWGEDTTATTQGKLWSLTMRVNAPHYRSMHKGVTGAVGRGADRFGSYLNYGQAHRGHLEGATLYPGHTNLIHNPTFAAGDFAGWVQAVISGSATVTWSTSKASGGAAQAAVSGSSGTVQLGQTVNGLIDGQNYVMSVLASVAATSLTSGWQGQLLVVGVTTSTIYLNQSITNGGSVWQMLSGSFTLSGDSAVYVELRAYNGASGGSGTFFFSKAQLEQHTIPSPFVDHDAHRISHANLYPFSGGYFDPTNGIATKFNYPLPQLGALLTYCVVSGADTSAGISLLIGTRTNGYELLWDTSGVLHARRWKAGSSTDASATGAAWSGGSTPAINTLVGATVTRDSATHLLRIGVDNGRFSTGNLSVEMAFDGLYVFSPASDPNGPSWTSGTTVPITVFSSNGVVQHFDVHPRDLYLAASVPFQNATPP